MSELLLAEILRTSSLVFWQVVERVPKHWLRLRNSVMAAAAVVAIPGGDKASSTYRSSIVHSELARLEKKRLDDIFKKHSAAGRMIQDQVRKMLQEANANIPPTDDEVAYIMKVADFNKDGTLQRKELDKAVESWSEYISIAHHAQQALETYAEPGTNRIHKEGLRRCLTAISNELGHTGKSGQVTDDDLDGIWSRAAVLEADTLSKPELSLAMLDWQVLLEERKVNASCACTLA